MVFTIISLDGKSWDFESTTPDVSLFITFSSFRSAQGSLFAISEHATKSYNFLFILVSKISIIINRKSQIKSQLLARLENFLERATKWLYCEIYSVIIYTVFITFHCNCIFV